MLEPQYSCILIMFDQCDLPTIKEGHSEGYKETLCTHSRDREYYQRQCRQWIIWKTIGYGVAWGRDQRVNEFQSLITSLPLSLVLLCCFFKGRRSLFIFHACKYWKTQISFLLLQFGYFHIWHQPAVIRIFFYDGCANYLCNLSAIFWWSKFFQPKALFVLSCL